MFSFTENVEWASCNLGIFLCQDCAGIHRSLGVDTSRVKSIKLDNWDDDQVMVRNSLPLS
jgi:ADP-ribosylation factor GTPase-activating protein 1